MHNEDNTLGLKVRSRGSSPTEWRAYGDSMLFDDKISKPTQTQCFAALKASVDEVFEAFSKKTTKAAQDFKAWDFAPTMTPTFETAASHDNDNHPPMFRVEGGKVLQRKGLLPYHGIVPKNAKWEFEPVVLDQILGWDLPIGEEAKNHLAYVYWSILAFRLTPYTTVSFNPCPDRGRDWMSWSSKSALYEWRLTNTPGPKQMRTAISNEVKAFLNQKVSILLKPAFATFNWLWNKQTSTS